MKQSVAKVILHTKNKMYFKGFGESGRVRSSCDLKEAFVYMDNDAQMAADIIQLHEKGMEFVICRLGCGE